MIKRAGIIVIYKVEKSVLGSLAPASRVPDVYVISAMAIQHCTQNTAPVALDSESWKTILILVLFKYVKKWSYIWYVSFGFMIKFISLYYHEKPTKVFGNPFH